MNAPSFFLSSTYEDLVEYRTKALTWFGSAQAKCSAMEFFIPQPHTSKETCLNEIEKSQVFILLLGDYYGSIPSGSTISFTEMEYNKAVSEGKDIYVFMISNGRNHGGDDLALDTFKKGLKEKHTIRYVTSPQNFVYWLAMTIYHEYPSLRPLSIQDNSFWDQLPIALQTHPVPEFAFELLDYSKELSLIEKLEQDCASVEHLLEMYRTDAEELPGDLMKFLKQTSTPTENIEAVPYYKNPFVNRLWELHNIGSNNMMSKIHITLMYLKAHALHRAIANDPADNKLYEALEEVKAELVQIYSSREYVD